MEGAMRRIGIIAVEAMLVSIEDPYTQYIAGGDLVIQPTDRYHATGTATFVDIAIPTGDLAPVTGSFEVTCPRP
jgi:hypothetical protein